MSFPGKLTGFGSKRVDPGGIPAWVLPNAIADIDPENNRAWDATNGETTDLAADWLSGPLDYVRSGILDTAGGDGPWGANVYPFVTDTNKGFRCNTTFAAGTTPGTGMFVYTLPSAFTSATGTMLIDITIEDLGAGTFQYAASIIDASDAGTANARDEEVVIAKRDPSSNEFFNIRTGGVTIGNSSNTMTAAWTSGTRVRAAISWADNNMDFDFEGNLTGAGGDTSGTQSTVRDISRIGWLTENDSLAEGANRASDGWVHRITYYDIVHDTAAIEALVGN